MIVKEHINFERGLDPKKSMNIGMEAQIYNFMKENAGENEEDWLSELIQMNGEYYGLEQDIQNAWIKHLLENGKGISRLDENDFYILREKRISWIPYVPFSSTEFKYEVIGGKYFVTFLGWENFIDLMSLDRNISEEFIIAVLSGDAYEFFDYDMDSYENISNFSYLFEKAQAEGKGLRILRELKEKAIKLGGNPDNMNTIESLFQEIEENEELSDLRDTIGFSIREVQESADESAAYNHMLSEIKKYYEIGDGEWDEEDKFRAVITKSGVEKISYALVTGDNKLNYSPPYNGYSGSVTPDDIVEALEYKIGDLK